MSFLIDRKKLRRLLSNIEFQRQLRDRMRKVKYDFLVELKAILDTFNAHELYLEIRDECLRKLKDLLA